MIIYFRSSTQGLVAQSHEPGAHFKSARQAINRIINRKKLHVSIRLLDKLITLI